MNLGQLIDRLTQLPKDMIVHLGGIHSYRGYHDEISIAGVRRPVPQALAECKKANGKAFRGWKGGMFVMNLNTPIWLSSAGECSNRYLTAINDDGSIEVGYVERD